MWCLYCDVIVNSVVYGVACDRLFASWLLIWLLDWLFTCLVLFGFYIAVLVLLCCIWWLCCLGVACVDWCSFFGLLLLVVVVAVVVCSVCWIVYVCW